MKKIILFAVLGQALHLHAQTWTPLSCGSTAEIYKISFPTIDTGYVSLNNNTVRRTTNSGATWSPCTVPSTPNYQLDFVTGQRGCMVQTHGVALTTDGAQTWTPVLTNAALDFYDVYFVDATVGFASALNSNLDSLYIYQTTNSGSTWNFVSVHSGPYNIFFPELYFISPSIGFTTFDAGILKTTDGGVTWSVVYTDPNTDVWNSMSSPDGVNIFGGGILGWLYTSGNTGSSWTAPLQLTYPGYGMYFSTASHGFYCGGNGSGSGAIEETNNGGTTWTPVYLTSQTLNCMDFPSPTRGYAGGTNGLVVRYDDTPQSLEENSLREIRLYPNPAHNSVTLENVSVGSTISVVNSIGEEVVSLAARTSLTAIDLTTFSAGVYLLRIVGEEKVETFRLIVE